MNIRKLIEKLEKFPEDYQVGVQIFSFTDDGVDFFSSVRIEEDLEDSQFLSKTVFLQVEDRSRRTKELEVISTKRKKEHAH